MSMKLPFLIAAFVMVFAVGGTDAEAQRAQRVDWSQYIDKDAKSSSKQEASSSTTAKATKSTRARPAKRAAASKAAAKPRAKKATKRRK
jgi:predicted lipid-binding transport protein (Tim44 family)